MDDEEKENRKKIEEGLNIAQKIINRKIPASEENCTKLMMLRSDMEGNLSDNENSIRNIFDQAINECRGKLFSKKTEKEHSRFSPKVEQLLRA